MESDDITRRDFVKTTAVAGIAAAAGAALGAQQMVETNVEIRTPDGIIPSRLLQIHWRKISATAPMPPVAAHPRASGGPAAN